MRVLMGAIVPRGLADYFDRVFWFVSARGGGQCDVGGVVVGLIGKGRRHGELDAARAVRTSAPIFKSLRRMVPHDARANWVWASPMRRKAQIKTRPALATLRYRPGRGI